MEDKEKLSLTGQEQSKDVKGTTKDRMKIATPGAAEAKEDEFKSIVRLGDKDIQGDVQLYYAITLVKGAGFMFANAVCNVLHLNKKMKIGELPQAEFDRLEDCLRNPAKYKLPSWLYNRRKDRETGTDMHLLSSDLDLAKKFDIQFLRKIKSFRGFRHSRGDKGLKVKARGQRTRSTGRKGKTVGVVRKKNLPQATAAKPKENKKGGK